MTIINGRRVPIIKTEIFKPTGRVKSLLKKFKDRKLTDKQRLELDRLLKKKTGFDYDVSRSRRFGKKIVPLKRLSATALSRARKAAKRISRRGVPRVRRRGGAKFGLREPLAGRLGRAGRPSRAGRPGRVGRVGRAGRPRRAARVGRPGRVGRVGRLGKVIRPARLPTRKGLAVKRKARKGDGFIVFEKRRGRFFRVKGAATSRKVALDRLAWRLENRISRTAKLVNVGKVKKLAKAPRKEIGQFRRTGRKLRNFKIRKGRKIRTPNTFIERKRFGISSPGEKRQLANNRRRVMLLNLAKARRVKAKNMKRKR